MNLSDSDNLLENMSADKYFENFKKVFIVYNYDDGYAPFYSSKIVDTPDQVTTSKMSFNFWSNVKVSQIL